MMESDGATFYIVGIGTSAGGLETLEKFFSNMPADSGLAFVVVQHLSPDYKSHMVQLLSKYTKMPVYEVKDSVQVLPNCVYLIPPKKNMTIFHRKLYLRDYGNEPGLNLPIDVFLRSLAEDVGEKAIALILSGTGSDGTRGIRAIKEAGGMVMAQDDSAKFDGMPRSAVATRLVDYILPPERMPIELLKFVQHPRAATDAAMKTWLDNDEDSLSKIFALLRTHNNIDFTYYKPNTIVRRIEHRMGINQIEKLSNYLHYLYQSKTEVYALYKELLIGVTKFFRDAEAFQFIQDKAIPAIFSNKHNREQVRIWVAACSTGEEAYSLAILIREYMERTKNYLDVKIFATDVDQDALDFAGRGTYSESIAADVSWERLRNFFIKKGETYEILRQVREMVIFAQQNLITDPPFSKIDLITCRNVLIYFQPMLQRKVLSTFQFALKPEGFLFLGSSETVGDQDNFFLCQHNKWKIYQHKGFRPSFSDPTVLVPLDRGAISSRKPSALLPVTSLSDDRRAAEELFKSLIASVLPPCVIIDKNFNIVHAFGDVGQFLEIPTGYNISMNLMKMAHRDLSVALSTALHKTFKDNQKITYNNISLKYGTHSKFINLTTKPITLLNNQLQLVLVIFEPVSQQQIPEEKLGAFDFDHNANQRIADLEQELQYTKENLQATIEELETSNEELQATNEELLAANEELQSTNEELQSVNEELITVNSEYQAKIQELIDLNNDMNNLFNNTEIGIIFLDEMLRVRKFTPIVQHNINLLEQDVGRPLSHLSHHFKGVDLVGMASQVLQDLAQSDYEVQNITGAWYRLRMMPYRTLEQNVKGIVITLMDVTLRKKAEMASHESEERFRRLAEATLEGVVFLEQGQIIDYNQSFATMFGYALTDLNGLSFFNLITPDFRDIVIDYSHSRTDTPYEVLAMRKDGSTFLIEIRGRDVTYQNKPVRVKVIRDLTLYKRNEVYRLMAHNLPNGLVLLFDFNLCFTLAEGQELAQIGLTKTDVEGKTIQDVFATQVVKVLEPACLAVLQGQTLNLEVTLNNKFYALRLIPMWSQHGEVSAGLILGHSITTTDFQEKTLLAQLEQLNILLVEDSSEIAQQIEQALPMLKLHGNLHLVGSGEEALAFLYRPEIYDTAIKPDLVIIDLNLPNMGGLTLLQQIKNYPRLKNVPILVLTSSLSEQDVLAAYNLNTNAYLQKPFKPELLLKAIHVALDSTGFVVLKQPM